MGKGRAVASKKLLVIALTGAMNVRHLLPALHRHAPAATL
jgi:hypothetical protein